ncbi:MAG: dTMP kinase [Pseudonocardiaceae bacterium]
MPNIRHTDRGRLISLEGLNGVGKTYLTTRVVTAADRGQPPVVVEGFSHRAGTDDLGRHLLRSLITASHGERFLRAGFPKSETLLLLAIKMHDFETTLPALRAGRTVIEGRSIHSTAVYQSLIMHPDDDVAALAQARQILDHTAHWRPLPDLTIVLTDDVEVAVGRAQARDGITYTAEQWQLHHRAAALFEHLTRADPDYVRLLDRREHDVSTLVATITEWISTAPARPFGGFGAATMVP